MKKLLSPSPGSFMRLRIALFSAVAWIILFTPKILFASAYEVYGASSRASSMGGAFTALADDFSATYYNMAGLIADKQIKATTEFLYAKPYLKVNSKDQHLRDIQGLNLGVSLPVPLADELENKIGFGLSLFVFGHPDIFTPQAVVLRGRVPEKPKYVFYDSYAERVLVSFGFGFELHPAFLFGAGTEVFVPIFGSLATVDTPTGYPDVSGRLGLYTYWSYRLGVILKPGEVWDNLSDLRIGLSYRDEFKVKFNLPVDAVLGSLAFGITLPTTSFFTPREATLGIAYDFTDNFTASFDLGWENWSKYHAQVPHVTFAASVSVLELGTGLYVPPEDFDDIWIPRIGGEYRYTSSPEFTWSFRGGYAYERSPAPEQTGISNYLDNDRHVFSLGLGINIGGKYFENPVIVDFFVQDHYLEEQKSRKDPSLLPDDDLTLPGFQSSNPGYPSIVSSGHVLSTGIGVTFTF